MPFMIQLNITDTTFCLRILGQRVDVPIEEVQLVRAPGVLYSLLRSFSASLEFPRKYSAYHIEMRHRQMRLLEKEHPHPWGTFPSFCNML
jgi:hypothetical protein